MIKEELITRHLIALEKLYSSLDTNLYQVMNMSNFRKEHKVQGHTFKAMCELDYIQRKGVNKGAKWKWGPRAKPQPHDARRVVERGIELKKISENRRAEEHNLKLKQISETQSANKITQEKPAVVKTPSKETIFPVINPAVNTAISPVVKNVNKKVTAKAKPSKTVIVQEERKSILWGLFTYAKIKRKES